MQDHTEEIPYVCFRLHLDTSDSDQNDIFDGKANFNFF
jgi:hypothetical protein